jgi:secreted PhoX family phosphatase
MAKRKKPVIDLSGENLTFAIDDATATLIAFNPNTMTLQLNLQRPGEAVTTDNAFPFAHLPKTLKKRIKPN